MTRARDIADQQENLGGAVAPFVGAKNFAINGGFDVWQRGTSFAVPSTSTSSMIADRWNVFRGATGSTASRQVTGDTTNLPNIQYCLRFQRDSGNTSTANLNLIQNLETVNSIPFAGKTATLSFYARAGANYSATSNALIVLLRSGTGTDQNFLNGYTGVIDVASGTATLTTTWQRFTFSGTVSTNATELAIQIQENPTGTAGANDWFEVTGVQLEIGSAATPFARAGGSIGGELALCQRYYQKSYPIDIAPGGFFLGGYSIATLQIDVPNSSYYNYQRLITRMRVAPTVVVYSGSGALSRMSTVTASDLAANSAVPNSISDTGFGIQNGSGGTLTQSAGGYLFYYTAIAEL